MAGRGRSAGRSSCSNWDRREPRKLAERPGVEPFEELGDGGVEAREREEGAMPEGGKHPALDDLHGHLRFRLVPWTFHPRGQHGPEVSAADSPQLLDLKGLARVGRDLRRDL